MDIADNHVSRGIAAGLPRDLGKDASLNLVFPDRRGGTEILPGLC